MIKELGTKSQGSQGTHKRLDVTVYICDPKAGKQRQVDPRDLLVSLAQRLNSRFSVRPGLKKLDEEEDIQC